VRKLRDAGIDQCGAPLFVEFGRDDPPGGGYRDVDGDRLDFGEGSGLLLGDPFLGQALAAFQGLFEIAGRLRGDALGFGLGVGDNCFGFRQPLALLELVGSQRALRLLA
jgi:hypothetical protein